MSSRAPTQTAEDRLDLDACAREPIHIPGAIQPDGLLFVIEPENRTVVQRAISDIRILREHDDPLGERVDAVLGGSLRSLSGELDDNLKAPTYLGVVTIQSGGSPVPYHATAHGADGMIVLELEEAGAEEPGSVEAIYPVIRGFFGELERSGDVIALCELAAREVRRLTGWDRVLVYRFDRDWNGTVIAEDGNDVLPSYLDLRFPASDIPAQARDLYRRNRLRLISSADYDPVPIEPVLNPLTGRPIDLSLAALRSVAPVHLQYMRNMGTGASMSISLLRDGQLWGLISCHNRDPLRVPYHVRTACDFIGQILSLQIDAKEHATRAELRVARRSIQARLLTRMSAADDFLSELTADAEELVALTDSAGAAVLHAGQCLLIGSTPPREQVLKLAAMLGASGRPDEFHTDSLAAVMPWAETIKDTASGVLAVSISQLHDSYIIWFRPEVIQTVQWGGDPNKPTAPNLSPRTSFDAWKQTVRLRSASWRGIDVEAAMELRAAIVDIVLRSAEEMADLNQQLIRSNKELEAFSYSVSHDLRAPFRHIIGYAELLTASASEKLDEQERRYAATIMESARSAGTLVDSLLSFSQMGRATVNRIPVELNRLVSEAKQQLEMEQQGRRVEWTIAPLPTVDADPIMLRLVFQNLFSNALKFTRDRDTARIEVGCERQGHEYVFFVRDNGCGFDMAYAGKLFGVFQRLHHADEFEGTGIGLANVRRILERHEGRTWAEGVLGEGATIYFTLPVRQGEANHGGSETDTAG
ncbi:ATP-binding protein [Altericroceibacterium xinjiangense]|uniref:ATP-binding protein n=1 Tax=Altericroceibacterium xinjiangense TaxID=762261 RepID=UPI000F7EEF0C|nr:ATP-binding protein [Altericroceibacterium xinjiangense]